MSSLQLLLGIVPCSLICAAGEVRARRLFRQSLQQNSKAARS
jgi:hypothetical protein